MLRQKCWIVFIIKMKRLVLFIFICYSLCGCAQQSITEVIDSLQTEYSLYPDRYPPKGSFDTIPPPLAESWSCEEACIKAYAIPSEIILQYYPWNADSITISFDSQFSPKSTNEEKLTKEDLMQFVNLLYQYTYDKDKPCVSMITIIGSGSPYPNFRLTFYHKEKSFFADFYKHIDNPIQVIDSSVEYPYTIVTNAYSSYDEYATNIFWGNLFHLTFNQLADYIEKRFGQDVRVGQYENDCEEKIEFLELEERTVIAD